MSQNSDIELVRENYQRLTDSELIRAATTDANGLTEDAKEIIAQEIEKRNLDETILKSVEAQNKSFTIEELDQYCSLLRNLSCPKCDGSTSLLNGTLTYEVMSFIFITHSKKKINIGCPECLDKLNEAALIKTLILGWWGFPSGIIRSIKAISTNIKSKKTNHLDTPNEYLRGVTLAKIGEIELHKNDKSKLQRIIANS